MSTHSSDVMLVAPPGAVVADIVDPLTDAGFAVHGTFQSGDFTLQAVVVLADAVDDPVSFTRQMRSSFPLPIPILWMLSKETAHLAVVGLDSGADACLLRPVHGPLLVAQLRALLRARTVTATADELRDLTGRLQKLYEQTEQDRALAERLGALTPTAIPDSSRWRFGVASVGGLEVLSRAPDGAPGLLLVDVAGLGVVGGGLAAFAIGRALAGELGNRNPADALTAVNRRLRGVALPDSAMLSATVVEFAEERESRLRVATAGFPAPVLVRPDAPAEVWLGSGPFLGTTDTSYAETVADLEAGEKLILLGRGAADRRPDVREIADAHRHLAAQPLADRLAAELGGEVTLVVAERRDS